MESIDHLLMSPCHGPCSEQPPPQTGTVLQGAAKAKNGATRLLVLSFLHFPVFLVKSLRTQSLAGALGTEDVSRGVLWRGDAVCEVRASADAPGLKSN